MAHTKPCGITHAAFMAFNPVAADERSEAKIERKAFANPIDAVQPNYRMAGIYDCCAAVRSLATLISGYKTPSR